MPNRAALFVITMCLPAAAQADGFYLAADIGISSYNDRVSTGATVRGPSGSAPTEATLRGQPFDSEETKWGLAAGWQLRDWLAVEVAFTDLGNSGQEDLIAVFGGAFGAGPIVVPNPPPPPLPPIGISGFVPANPVLPGRAALDAEEWSLSARFNKQLIDKLSANWLVGLTRTDYSAEGTFPFAEIDTTVVPFDVTIVEVPYAAPDAETGYVWGLGFGWQTSASTTLELSYRQHKTDVIDVDTTSLRLLFAF